MNAMSHLSDEKNTKGHALFAGECTFMLSVVKHADLPPLHLPEVCFAGRSNVGKSSLINALTGRKMLAKVSNTPGRTQCLNYFNIGEKLYLVDMPGYGYAEAPKALVKQWQGLIRDYLLGRSTLKRVFLLIDSRHGIKENDRAMMTLLDECGVSYQIILTKGDKISDMSLKDCHETVTLSLQKHPAAHPLAVATSSEKRQGITLLQNAIADFI